MKLILVCGLPGSGKTTVSRKIARRTGSHIFNTDTLRKEMFTEPTYSEEEKKMVYDLLFSITEKFLKSAKNVVLDGTFYKKELRDRVRELAKRNESEFHMVKVVCDEGTIRERMEKRKRKKSFSDADYGVYKKVKSKFEPLRGRHHVIESGKNEDAQIRRLVKKI